MYNISKLNIIYIYIYKEYCNNKIQMSISNVQLFFY